MDVSRIKIEPAIIYWGTTSIQTITCVADIAGSLRGKSFKLYAPGGAKYIVWFKVAGTGSAPVVAGFTPVQVTVSATGATAEEVATALKISLLALNVFAVVSTVALVTVKCISLGLCDPALEVDSGFTFAVITAGKGGELGYTDGATEFKPTVETKDITANQSGNTSLAELVTKVGVDKIALTLKEVDKDQIKAMFSGVGYSELIEGGTEVTGMGTKKIGSALNLVGLPLIFHPKSKAAADLSEDVMFWVACPKPGSMKFSGTDNNTLVVDFSIYPDPTKNEQFNLFVYGDWSQNFSKV